jgi:hypothetical protein
MRRTTTQLALAGLILACRGGADPAPAPSRRIGGVVIGLAGSGLVLHSSIDAGPGEDLSVAGPGVFLFPTKAADGARYSVTVASSPASPWQACAVANGTGTVGDADVTVSVSCTTRRFAVGGLVSGLLGTGLIIQDGLGQELPLATDGSFLFAAPVESGSDFAVTVKSHPSAPWQTCSVAKGAGTVGAEDVTDVLVHCETNPYAVGGTASGLVGIGLVLHDGIDQELVLTANGAFVFPRLLPSGSSFAVAVKSHPSTPWQTCSVANGTGTVGAGDVNDVAVSCQTNRYTVGGMVNGLAGMSGLVLQNNGTDDLAILAEGSFAFATPAESGGSYQVTVKSQPAALRCSVANSNGTVGGAAVASVTVSCSVVVQAWEAPTVWGALWPDSPTLLQHAHFDGTALVEDKGITWTPVGSMPPQTESRAFPAGARWAAGPFEGTRYQATGGTDATLDQRLRRDMLVCAVIKPHYNPSVPLGDGREHIILAKGLQAQPPGTPAQAGAGWVLMQMHDMFCFHYQYLDGTTSRMKMAYTPTYFADRNHPDNGPLDPSYVVVCAGRDGDTLVSAANGYPDADAAFTFSVTGDLEVGAVPHPLTIGGYDTADPNHTFGGRVFETAIWAEPATRENIQAKMNAVLGLPAGARYTRNREGPWVFTGGLLDGAYHTAWRHGPRIDPARGFLFGLQGWNRLTYPDPTLNCLPDCSPADMTIGQRNPVVATGEDLSGEASPGVNLWTRSAGASIARDPSLRPPGDSGQAWADHVTLAPGASISRALGTFDAAGPIHAMLWIRPGTASGLLTIRTTRPDPATGMSDAILDLRTRATGWSRAWLEGLTTDGSTTAGTLFLENEGSSTIDFYAWGLDLTQIGGGGDLGDFDPGVAMYDWGAGDNLAMSGHGRYPVDVLELVRVPTSTAQTGFCLSVDAQPPPGLPWNAPFARNRALVGWVSEAGAGAVSILMEGTAARGSAPRRLCFSVAGGGSVCGEPPSWPAGSRHSVTGCASPSGTLRLYLDGVPAGTQSASAPPDLAAGHVLVGNAAIPAAYTSSIPWHGYVSKALVCPDTGVTPSGCR